MKPNGVDEEHVKLKGFPFPLKGATKAWRRFSYSLRFHWNLEWHEEDFPWKVFPSLSSY
jgi:hypothetical protein